MRFIDLEEYKTKPNVLLTSQQRDQLSRLAPSISIAPSPGSNDHYDLTPDSVVGTVMLGDLQIIVHPKLTIENVLFLVSYALDLLDKKKPDPSTLGKSDSLVEAMIPSFLHHVKAATGRGLLRDYLSVEDSLNTVRGRILLGDQIARHHGRVPPIEVSFDEHTEDILENRLLATATDRLLRLGVHNSELRDSLRESRHMFSGVSRITEPAREPEIHWTRLNGHYQPAVRLATLILKNTGFDLQQGDAPASTFLVDMNQVFEGFVHTALREKLGLGEHAFPRGSQLCLDEAGSIRMHPDLSWWQGKQCRFIGDVKYKQTDDGMGKHADLYQLLAYVTAAGLDEGLLIYAAGESEPATHEIPMAGKRLRVETLNLAATPEEILGQVEQIANYIKHTAFDMSAIRVA
ncbi:McrC family protein [Candidatus Poriferisocius sp.]|uniref:McrC family protein n=1 Tax=Candidatus Poriferisocius sp. TaxID=3101276 RepID=UPI003B029277